MMKRTRPLAAAVIGALILAPLAVTPAEATWPGPNGMITYVGGVGGNSPDHQVYVVNPDGSGRHRLTDVGGNGIFRPEWSPDGNRLLAWEQEFFGRSGTTVVLNADGTGRTPVSTEAVKASWSRDGSKRSVTPSVVGPSAAVEQVVTIAPNGTGRTQLTTIPTYKWIARWSPTDDRIAFGSSLNTSSPDPDDCTAGSPSSTPTAPTGSRSSTSMATWTSSTGHPTGRRSRSSPSRAASSHCARISAARLRHRLRRPGPGVPPEHLRRHGRHRGRRRHHPGPQRMDERGVVARRRAVGRHRQRGSRRRPRRRHAARGRWRGHDGDRARRPSTSAPTTGAVEVPEAVSSVDWQPCVAGTASCHCRDVGRRVHRPRRSGHLRTARGRSHTTHS